MTLLAVRFRMPAASARVVFLGFMGLTVVRLSFIAAQWTAASQQSSHEVVWRDGARQDARLVATAAHSSDVCSDLPK